MPMHRRVFNVRTTERKVPDYHVRQSDRGVSIVTFSPIRMPPLQSCVVSRFFGRIESHAAMSCGYGKETFFSLYLLSNDVGVMAGLDFKGAVIGP